jgi:hypothetical protein
MMEPIDWNKELPHKFIVHAHLRDTRTGKTTCHHEPHCSPSDKWAAWYRTAFGRDPLLTFTFGDVCFQWFENNYACDCNRALFLYGGSWDSFPCGDGGIAVDYLAVLAPDGTPIYGITEEQYNTGPVDLAV